MRSGLRVPTRKVWALSGMPVCQAVPIGWSHADVAVVLEPRTERLWWGWQKDMQWCSLPAPPGWIRWNASSGSCAGPSRGRSIPTLQAKQDVLEPTLKVWQADPDWVGNGEAGTGPGVSERPDRRYCNAVIILD